MTAGEAVVDALLEGGDFEDVAVDGTYEGPNADETTISAVRNGRAVVITVEELR
jgi:hypothetical protein